MRVWQQIIITELLLKWCCQRVYHHLINEFWCQILYLLYTTTHNLCSFSVKIFFCNITPHHQQYLPSYTTSMYMCLYVVYHFCLFYFVYYYLQHSALYREHTALFCISPVWWQMNTKYTQPFYARLYLLWKLNKWYNKYYYSICTIK